MDPSAHLFLSFTHHHFHYLHLISSHTQYHLLATIYLLPTPLAHTYSDNIPCLNPKTTCKQFVSSSLPTATLVLSACSLLLSPPVSTHRLSLFCNPPSACHQSNLVTLTHCLLFPSLLVLANIYNIGAGVPPGGGGKFLTGFGLWYGGIVQILAGMWAMKVGNTFEATAFSSFGAYWAAYGYMFFPGSGMEESYAGISTEEYQNAKGIFILIWWFLAMILTVGTTKSTIATIVMFITLDIHLLLAAINDLAHLSAGAAPARISAVFGILTALMAFWNGAASLWLPSNSHILLPVGPVGRKNKEVYSV